MKLPAFTGAFCILAFLAVSPVRADAPDLITARLEKARTKFNADMEKFRTTVSNWYDRQEAAARNDGNKQRLDQLKQERAAFDSSDDLAPTVPTTLRDARVAARSPMEAALRTAIKQYTAAKRDAEADAVVKQLDEFVTTDAPRTALSKLIANTWLHKGHFIYKFSPNGTYELIGNKRHGRYTISRDGKQIALRWEGESREDEFITIDRDHWTLGGLPFTPQR